MSNLPVSALIVTKNAGEQLDRCLSALKGFDEILVIDSYSPDQTNTIARAHNVPVINFKWNGTYPKKRQWCLDTLSLKHDWVFFVDADEVITPELVEEIRTLFQTEINAAGYFITGQYVWNGQPLKYGLKNRKIGLLNRRLMHFPEIDDLDCPGMGEIEGHYQPVLKPEHQHININNLKSPLLHYANYSPEEWHARHERYAAWEICMTDKDAWPADPVQWREYLKAFLRWFPLRPELAFFHSYILKLGVLDGNEGLNLAKSRLLYYKMTRGKR